MSNLANQQKSRLLHSLPTFFDLLTISFLTFGIILYFKQFFRHAKSSLGINDEAFQVFMVKERILHGSKSYSWPFSEILFPLFKLSGEEIYHYRILGLVGLVFISVFSFWIVLSLKREEVGRFTQPLLGLSVLVVVLGIPSTYNYLLITPGYQWMAALASVLTVLVILTFTKQPLQDSSSPNASELRIVILVGLTLITAFARLTDGLITYLGVIIWMIWENSLNLKSKLTYIIGIPSIAILVTILNFNSLRARFVATYLQAKAVDPKGYSLFNEILDVGRPIIYVMSLLLIGYLASSIFVLTNPFQVLLKKLPILILVIPIQFSVLHQIPRYDLICITFICLAIGAICGFAGINIIEFKYLPIMGLPYLMNFGSNAKAASNSQSIYLSLLFLLVLSFRLGEFKKFDFSLNRNKFITSVSGAVIAFMLLGNVVSSQNVAFAKILPASDTRTDPRDGLQYTNLELNYKAKFREEIASSSFKPGTQILDLSFFHTGAILEAGGIPASTGLGDKFWINNLSSQFNYILKSQRDKFLKSANYLLIEGILGSGTLTQSHTTLCTNLTKLIGSKELINILKSEKLDPQVKSIGILRSDNSFTIEKGSELILVKTC